VGSWVLSRTSSRGQLQDLPSALPQLTGVHSGEKIAEVVSKTLQQFTISSRTIGYLLLDNASNNDTAVLALAQNMDFKATDRGLNLIGQVLL
jgi:hypothetical protein